MEDNLTMVSVIPAIYNDVIKRPLMNSSGSKIERPNAGRTLLEGNRFQRSVSRRASLPSFIGSRVPVFTIRPYKRVPKDDTEHKC
jgi:hypothetical protein